MLTLRGSSVEVLNHLNINRPVDRRAVPANAYG
jgi:hypothetical protein